MPDVVPHYCMREFCAEHGRRGATELHHLFPEDSLSGWKRHRLKMHRAHPDLVPLLNQQGNPIARMSLTEEVAEQTVPGAEFGIIGDERTSTQFLPLTREQLQSPDALMEAHGFDPAEWQLSSATNKVWNMASKGEAGHDVSTLYSSAIKVAPKKAAFDVASVVEALRQVAPVRVTVPRKGSPCLLEVPLFDMHFGVSDLAHYADTLERIREAIASEKRAQVLFAVGSDLFHNDNFRNTTAGGTVIDTMDFTQAFADAGTFYSTLIEEALRRAVKVSLVFVKGNHDESMSWAFCKMLEAKYPQLACDLAIEERKVHTFGDVCIGFTHGDKARKSIDRVFMAEHESFRNAAIREIHTGHYHHEAASDEFGVMVRTLSTGNRTDKWSRDNGFLGSHKRFMLFDYQPDALTNIRYV